MDDNFKVISILSENKPELLGFNCIPRDLQEKDDDFVKLERINNFLIDPNFALKLAKDNIFQTFLLIDSKNNKVAGFFSLCVGSKATYKGFKKKKKVPTIGNMNCTLLVGEFQLGGCFCVFKRNEVTSS